ncbi:SAM-dependent methyltransferase [Nocardioides cavernae]|uniref:SAM-dependent methyltransferase n=1 Tax=Nocardioides cavernae TaxID=1921566 RepID=A0A7Y9KN52_9ACTN|nr:class I SAM-dependent methyltransferase [Nocardioides cavernae]NYE35336.1 SAM-dependent methyltransferase [Nocardioides cavernae]
MALRSRAQSFAGGTLARGMARVNARHPWSHNDHFHPWILRNLPDRRRAALDIGCGEGALVASLAPHFTTVVGNDVDPGMLAATRARCSALPNVTVTGEAWAGLPGPFDLVTMVAVLHHLDVPAALTHVASSLAPGGRFLAVGIAPPRSARDHAWDAASILTNPVIGFVKHPRADRSGPRPTPYPVVEPTLALDDLRRHVEDVMPGARVRHRLAFRHTVAWTRPA